MTPHERRNLADRLASSDYGAITYASADPEDVREAERYLARQRRVGAFVWVLLMLALLTGSCPGQ